jgi:Fe2+ transport system protein FeoA
MTLNQLKPAMSADQKAFPGIQLGRRLLAMGFCPGLRLRVIRNAPLRTLWR